MRKLLIKKILVFSFLMIIGICINQSLLLAQEPIDSSTTYTENTYNLNTDASQQSITDNQEKRPFYKKIFYFLQTIFKNIKSKIEDVFIQKEKKEPKETQDNNPPNLLRKKHSDEPILIFNFQPEHHQTKDDITNPENNKESEKNTKKQEKEKDKKQIQSRQDHNHNTNNKSTGYNNSGSHNENNSQGDNNSNGSNSGSSNNNSGGDNNEDDNENSGDDNEDGGGSNNDNGNDDNNDNTGEDDNESDDDNNQDNSITKNVLIINYLPDIENQSIISYYNWNNPNYLASQLIQALNESSHGILHYNIKNIVISRTFPQKEDSFQYNETTYKQCMSNHSTCHMPDTVDYAQILTQFNVCPQVNNNEVDEVWIFGGPYFGFYESQLAGTNGYWYNSPPLNFPACQRLVPIMGFNYERGVAEAIHSYGHRIESTMSKLYGGWQENHTRNLWEKFALVKKQSPDYDYSGCGSVHYPPNGRSDYDYSNHIATKSNCYYLFNNDTDTYKMIQCSDWNCTQEGYLKWWMSLMPHTDGTDNLGKRLNWWYYIADPNNAL